MPTFASAFGSRPVGETRNRSLKGLHRKDREVVQEAIAPPCRPLCGVAFGRSRGWKDTSRSIQVERCTLSSMERPGTRQHPLAGEAKIHYLYNGEFDPGSG